MPVSPYLPTNHGRIFFPEVRSLYPHIPLRWIFITAMAVFFFPLTMTTILFNEAGFGLILAALVSISLVVIGNLLPLPEKYIKPVFGLGICIDLGVITRQFSLKVML